MTHRFMYGLSLNDFNGDDTSSSTPPANPGAPAAAPQQRRSSYASVAANRVRSAARASVSQLLNPAPPSAEDDDDEDSTDDATTTNMHRGHFYSSVRDYDRNIMARTNNTADRPPSQAVDHYTSASSPTWLPKNTGLPWHSRAYDFFMSRDAAHLADELSSDSAAHSKSGQSKLITPSYLRGTVYMDKLEVAHRRRLQALRESQQSHPDGSVKPPSRPASHRGIALDVVERTPSKGFGGADGDDEDGSSSGVTPLPSRWNPDDKHAALDVVGEGHDVKYSGPKSSAEKDHEACAIRADHHMPGRAGVYYFEVTVMARKHHDTTVVVGVSGKAVSLSRAPGWEPESYGYHADDGNVFHSSSQGKSYASKYGPGDTVGCLVNFQAGTINFTKNGEDLGVAFRDNTLHDMKGRLFPTIGLKKPGDHVSANFGQMPFMFDIDGYVKGLKDKVWKKIRQADTSKLVPGLNETELIQQLVLQHLQHDGFVETARAFAEEIVAEKTRLQLDPNETVPTINVRDDEDARKRQQIRRAILEGNIDQALKFTNTYYPKVLASNNGVYFRLRCRKFIEMIRQDAEANLTRDMDRGNPATSKPPHPSPANDDDDDEEDMELDNDAGSGEWVGDPMEDEEEEDRNGDGRPSPRASAPASVGQLLQEALEYGQELRAEFADSAAADPDMSRQLDEIFALIAYENPLREEGVRHLLDRGGRVAVAEELNSAILLSLGKQSRSALENLYGQTEVLLERLREDGRDGAFVGIKDVMDHIDNPPVLR